MPCTVGHVVVGVRRLTHLREDELDHRAVVLLAVGADQVRLPDHTLVEDRQHRRRMIIGVDPVAHVVAGAVELRTDAAQHVRDLSRDELLDVLVRAVVVRAVRDGRLHAERAYPRPHEQIAARLGGGVRRRGVVRGLLGEPLRVVELEVTVDLIRGDVMEAALVPAGGLEQRVGADDVRVEERTRVVQRVVVVRLRGVVHHGVGLGEQRIDERGIHDVALDELDPILGQPGQRSPVPGVGELVENRHVRIGVRDDVVHEVGADEAGTTGHEQAGHRCPRSSRSSR